METRRKSPTTPQDTRQTLDRLEGELSALRELLAEQERAVLQARQDAFLDAPPRGSSDTRIERVEEPTSLAKEKPSGVGDSILAALRGRQMSLPHLAEAVGAPAGRVQRALSGLRRAGRVANVGSGVDPKWTAIVGDRAPQEEIYAAIEALISARPMTRRELCLATGVREDRVSGALVRFSKKFDGRLMNLGNGRRALWYLAPESSAASGLYDRIVPQRSKA